MKKKLFVLLLLAFLLCCAGKSEAKLWENFQTRSNLVGSIKSVDYLGCQTFTATSTHSISGIKVWSYVQPGITQFSNLRLKKTCATDTQLAIASLVNNSMSNATSGYSYTFFFDNAYQLPATGTYAMLFENNLGSGKYFYLKGSSFGGYSGGTWSVYDPFIGDWLDAISSIYFEIYGEDLCTSTEDMCACTTTLNYIANTSTGAGFWLDSSIGYGDFLVVACLLLIVVILGTNLILSLEIPKRMNFKKN
jgi:hypothetical protein